MPLKPLAPDMLAPDALLYGANLTTSMTWAPGQPLPAPGDCVWYHLCAINIATRTWLEASQRMSSTTIDAMLAEDTRPRVLIKPDGVLINVRAINTYCPTHPEQMVSLRIWTDGDVVLTCRRDDNQAVEQLREHITQRRGPLTAGGLVVALMREVYEEIEHYIDELERCVAELELHVNADDALQRPPHNISDVRRKIALYRRYIFPQAKLLSDLSQASIGWLSDRQRADIIEQHDRVLRYTEELNDIRDRAEILYEEIKYQQGAELNKTTYLFSIAATIFLPLSFLTGLLGINVGGIPGAAVDFAFWIFVVLCVMVVGAQIVYFRRKKWF
ncbi:hypothetical protein NH514_15405 [Pseudoalteromonas sp. ACER1]|jgi:zinc transporter|uniref:CorA-like Mg2+ transporter family protein n=1 Tax=Alteromonas macleodii TaxID=28108 RepID=A0AB36FKY8_ALTMA|nr:MULTISPECIES: CorA family divalent cation transporter [Alteromonadales]EKO3632882.1 hypothetical protein [Vibrio metschnikovii]EKO3671119.1 hypothetical protein [Vibrio metschnikovii]EKO3729864.1 hypothetical protein [Vibrio metschnikovii]MCF2848321.1 hypothetical protein [Pseudoalteromonas sp. PAST1]MCG7639673.1 hypothetical protein [Alteromonas sp. CNT1-28]